MMQAAGYAYITDSMTGALIVYSYTSNAARRFESVSTKANPQVRPGAARGA